MVEITLEDLTRGYPGTYSVNGPQAVYRDLDRDSEPPHWQAQRPVTAPMLFDTLLT